MINRISKIASMALVLVMALTMAIGCKTVEPEEEATVETSEEAAVETEEAEEMEEEAEAEEPDTVTITDSSGREVTINKPIERIIPLGSDPMLAVIKVLGAGDKVVGVNQYTKDYMTTFFPELSKLPSVGSLDAVDYEKIFELKPDIVIAAYFVLPGELEEKLGPEITVVRLDIGPPLTYEEDVKKLGLILEKEDKAVEYINWYQNYVDNIVEKVGGLSEEDKPLVFEYYGGDWGMSEGPPYGTYGKDNSWVNPMFEMAGSINIAANLPGDWITVDPEWVIEQNPSIIIREVFPGISGDIVGFDAKDTSGIIAMREDIMSDDALKYTDAVKGEEVYLIDGGIVQSYWFIGLQYMAKLFHPELFKDLDPQVIHQEFLTDFQGLDYNLNERGVFVYPES